MRKRRIEPGQMESEDVKSLTSRALAAIEVRMCELERREASVQLAAQRVADTASTGGDRVRLNVGITIYIYTTIYNLIMCTHVWHYRGEII